MRLLISFIYWLIVTGLGDDSKLPFQVRLLTAASKQNFSMDSKSAKSWKAMQSFAAFSEQSAQTAAPTGSKMAPIKLSDYMYLDKSRALPDKPHKSNGFSIEEIMKH